MSQQDCEDEDMAPTPARTVTSSGLDAVLRNVCKTCHQPGWNDDQEDDTLRDLDSFLKSGMSGCYRCSAVHKGIIMLFKANNMNFALEKLEINCQSGDIFGVKFVNRDRYRIAEVHDAPESKKLGEGHLDEETYTLLSLRIYTHQDNYNSNCLFSVRRSVPLQASHPQAQSIIGCWLRDCLENHSSCRVESSEIRPARLLKFDPNVQSELRSKTFSEFLVQLVETPQGEQPCAYLALSYCWGNNLPLKTTKSKLSDHQQGIHCASLPRIFQDAIWLTSRLGYGFLWIDALCIIQDNSHDWEVESSKMASVYEQAVATISVAGGNTTTADSLFASRNFPGMRHNNSDHLVEQSVVGFDYHVESGSNQTAYISEQLPHENLRHRNGQVPPSIFKRGWTFQERLLSTRVLQFLSSEIAWECRTGFDCECGDASKLLENRHPFARCGIYHEHASLMTKSTSDLVYGSPCPVGMVDDDRQRHAEEWQILVEEYFTRQLTRPDDMLPAISGIAHRIRQPRLGSYKAGMWESFLPMSLLWCLNGGRNPHSFARRAIPYRAPTWSWASIDSNAVNIYHEPLLGNYQRRNEAHVEAVECVQLGEDPMGRVKAGFILLQVPVIRARLTSSDDFVVEWRKNVYLDLQLDITLTTNRLLVCDDKADDIASTRPIITLLTSHEGLRQVRDAGILGEATLAFILLGGDLALGNDDPSIPTDPHNKLAFQFLGLCLRQREQNAQEYERCGIFSGLSAEIPRIWALAQRETIKII